ncbi:hypothetical protein D8674_007751 [Pyrus ussuriensis x Pyrus communis]|uniref:Uncharacterized protein n=1 Tax=Pyrus ussuriensis x Pyrus communis TaxID=2448454 RepID=A0A5N5HVQ3_9ROSA|nr:hypothetical protein D8674_007751 [Pyrus ussuriensis x Pyrus communis]
MSHKWWKRELQPASIKHQIDLSHILWLEQHIKGNQREGDPTSNDANKGIHMEGGGVSTEAGAVRTFREVVTSRVKKNGLQSPN